jgi:hypothetical protein
MSPVKSLEKLFCREADACADWSVADTGTTELSEHPNNTNAMLAVSSKTSDIVFIASPFPKCGSLRTVGGMTAHSRLEKQLGGNT